jgi:hypothetical protein
MTDATIAPDDKRPSLATTEVGQVANPPATPPGWPAHEILRPNSTAIFRATAGLKSLIATLPAPSA